MKGKQRIIALIICCATILACMIQGYAQGDKAFYSDVRSADWFAGVVGKATKRGILSGYPDGSFKPGKEVTYGEFLAMSMALEVITHEEKPAHWAKGYYDHAVKMNYIEPEDFSLSQLDQVIPRKAMAQVMAGLISARQLEISGENMVFSDVSPEDPYLTYIDLCARAKVLSGYPDGTFRPNGHLKRSEAASAVMNYIKLIDDSILFGNEVLEIDGQYMTYTDSSGQCLFGTKDKVIGDSDRPDPNEGIHPVNLMREDHKKLLDQIAGTAKISGTPGNYTLTYTQPDIPERYHFAVDLVIYEANSEGGDDTLFFKHSDAGWMSDPNKYDPKAQSVKWDLGSKIRDFKNKCVILTFEIDDLLNENGDFGEAAAYQYIMEYDGSMQRVSLSCRLTDGKFKDYYRYDDMPCPAFCW